MLAGCWDLDLATGILSLCPHSQKMFGLSADSTGILTEKEWVDRVHPEDLPIILRALNECLVHETPYAERFRTIHSDGSVQFVLGVGRPLGERHENCRFVGWNFDLEATGRLAGEWISRHPDALKGGHLFSIVQPNSEAGWLSEIMPPQPFVERARTILRIRRSRERLLGRAMIGEPAFDLFLMLYVRSQEGEISLSSLAKSAGVPYSSAVRWITYLIDKGYVSRRGSKSDRRASLVHLTQAGRAVLDEFLAIQ